MPPGFFGVFCAIGLKSPLHPFAMDVCIAVIASDSPIALSLASAAASPVGFSAHRISERCFLKLDHVSENESLENGNTIRGAGIFSQSSGISEKLLSPETPPTGTVATVLGMEALV